MLFSFRIIEFEKKYILMTDKEAIKGQEVQHVKHIQREKKVETCLFQVLYAILNGINAALFWSQVNRNKKF